MKYAMLKNRVTGERRIYNSETKVYTSENDNPVEYARLRKLAITNRNKAERDQVYRDCGLVRVTGSLGGKYWE